ncbi:MAG: site-specific integrase, partial [Methylococcales bacterium]
DRAVISSFLVFIVDLGFRDYSISRVSARTGQDQNRITSLIRAVLRKAERVWGWIDKSPAIRRLKVSEHRIRWLTKMEAENLYKQLPIHLQAMMMFTLATGLRESNVTGLEWSQIDLQRKVAWVYADQAKGKKAIGIPLNADALQVIHSQMGLHPVFVFTYRGSPVDKAGTDAWKKALKRAGIENFNWHGLRHTWASWHVQAGTPLNVLQELGGWGNYSMVLRYAHLAAEHLLVHADKISGLAHFMHTKTEGIKKAV